jgi:hypothetical protein
MKIVAAGSTETLVNTRRHISDASKLHTQCRNNLKSDFAKWFPVFGLPQTYHGETEQEYQNPELFRFLQSSIELVGVEERVRGVNARVWYLSEEQIKGVIHPRSVYRGEGIRTCSAFYIGSAWRGRGGALGTGDRWLVMKWRNRLVISRLFFISMRTFRMSTLV